MSRRFLNSYYGLRHGTSIANERGIIISHPDNGTTGWGLSQAGIEECHRSLRPENLSVPLSRETTRVYTSDFTRAHVTAEIFCLLNNLSEPVIDTRLRERHFGELERQSANRYGEVWERDAREDAHGYAHCEATSAVAERMIAVIDELDAQAEGMTFILVSHGDPIQIAETVLAEQPSHTHRDRPHVANCELRPLAMAS